MEELLNINDKQDMDKYGNSIDRIALNFGLDCLDGKEDKILAEDIKNIYELLDRCHKLEEALDKACDILEEGYGEEYASYIYMKNLDEVVEIPAHMNINEWKDWLMKDE